MSKKEVLKTNRAPKPMGHYSQAVRVGNLLFISGTLGIDPETNEVVAPGDIVAQTERTMENIKIVLESFNLGLEDVVKTLCFVDELDDFGKFNEVYSRYFPNDPPARSTVEIGKFKPGMRVEVEAIAVFPE